MQVSGSKLRWRNTAIHIIFFPLNYVVIFSRNNEIFSRNNEIFSRYNEIFSRYNEIFSRNNDIFSR